MMAHHKFYIGDTLEVAKQLPSQSVQTIVTSPPYWGLRDYGDPNQLGLEPTPEEYVTNLVKIFREYRRVLSDDGTLWLNLGDTYNANYRGGGQETASEIQKNNKGTVDFMNSSRNKIDLPPKNLVGIPWRVAFALQQDGWYLRQDIIWHKPNPMPESVKDRCTKAHEYIFLLTKSQKYFYDAEAVKEVADTAPTTRNKHAEGYQADYAKGDRFSKGERVFGADGKRNKRSVWTVSTKPFSEAHFAVFPPDLIEPCILAGSRKGDTVLDPFGGSGTTTEVCMKHDRNSIYVDLSQEYLDIALKRTGFDRSRVLDTDTCEIIKEG